LGAWVCWLWLSLYIGFVYSLGFFIPFGGVGVFFFYHAKLTTKF